ncbi:hypothetical protein K5I29_02050 [Flavobacterium agricola]|uniref:Uncharacterized protein n=1 Tax=Flavobacterium agricola TaxID=2870839 RepID=A0ABY6LZJ0_9FLAO|nr:hypothetical protein [Flavobacterium agricola]UYW01730.1 hypothetical protein K5I29_02050 [Flavobacterium agricola]
MKKLYWPILFVVMIWALMDQASENPNKILQIVVVVIFFYAMMKLMAKTPNNKNKENEF